MAERTTEEVFNAARQLPPKEIARLINLLKAAQEEQVNQNAPYDPLLAHMGAWADMGDEAIDAFDEAIQHSRAEPGRDVELGV